MTCFFTKTNTLKWRLFIFLLLFSTLTVTVFPNEKAGAVGGPLLKNRPGFSIGQLTGQQEMKPTVNYQPAPSMGKAFLYSVLLPGAGELYAGSKKMAAVFAGTELLLWTTFFSMRAYGNCKKEDYIDYAIAHAGIDPSGKNHQYFVDIEHFDDIRAYNEAKLQQRDVDALYPENDEYGWLWDSKSKRLKYEKIRVASDKAFSRSIMMIGAIVVNHLVSGIDAIRAAKKQQKDFNKQVKIGFIPRPEGGMKIALFKFL